MAKKIIFRSNSLPLVLLLATSCLCLAAPIEENKTSDAITLDFNNEETLKSLEEIIGMVRKIRQNDPDSTTIIENPDDDETVVSSSTKTTTTTEATTTTTQNSNLSDLEDSFGGLGNVREVKQPEKLNGFYFLADINSFLEVGDGDEKVVVKFNPKIGNPKNFISIPGNRT